MEKENNSNFEIQRVDTLFDHSDFIDLNEIFKEISEEEDIDVDTVKEIVYHMFEETRYIMSNYPGNRILLHNLGSFQLNEKRTLYSLRTLKDANSLEELYNALLRNDKIQHVNKIKRLKLNKPTMNLDDTE